MDNLKTRLIRLQEKKKLIENDLQNTQSKLRKTKSNLADLLKARWVLAEVSKNTQELFKDHVESLVTLAIQSVFEDRNFEFKLIFEQKRNTVECRPVIVEDGEEFQPENEMGGSILDIISFAFRVVLWSMETPKNRNLIILDEPFGAIDKNLISKAGKMLSDISHELKLQIILTTLEPLLAEIADKAFQVTYKNGISTLEELME